VALALGAAAIVVVALLSDVLVPRAAEALARRRARRARPVRYAHDPGRERRAEQRARELLRSCVSEQDWEMYRDLGFLRVWGGQAGDRIEPDGARGAPYAYLLYPHRPLVAYVPQTHRLLSEYCVEFPDRTRPYGSARLPDSDDVLAKWMALTGDERGLIRQANMHLPGRQVDPRAVKRDLWRLGEWERARARHDALAAGGTLSAP